MEKIYDKKIDIINSSIYLFSQKGFALTSVQDIAAHCNMSKATIYKIFKSKEEIFISIIEHINKQMFINIESVDFEVEKDPLLTLEKKFVVFFKNLYERKHLTIMIYENQSLMKDPRFESIILKNRTFSLNWYKTILADAFGDKIRDILWDIVLATSGLIKEFNYIFIIKETISHDFEEIAKFMVKAISAIIECHYKDKPLVPPDLFEFFEKKVSINRLLLIDEWGKKVTEIQTKINEEKNLPNKNDILDAVDEITKEIKKEHPRKFLIDSLLLYLGKFEIIETDILYLKNLYLRAEL